MTLLHAVVPVGLDDPRRPSGGNLYDRKVLDGLRALGWTVHEHPVPGPWSGLPASARPALEDVLRRRDDGDLVVVDGLVVAAAPRLVTAAGDRLRLVVLAHMPQGHQHPEVAADERTALSAATAVVTTSRWTRAWLREEYDLPADEVHVVLPGTDPADLAPGTDTGRELLCVGAVIPGKGHDLLLSAFAEVADLDWRCACVGALDVDEGFVASLQQTARELGLSDRVHFVGPLVGADLGRAYAGSDVLVLASRGETYGMVVAEALARGLPVVTTDVGGVTEALGRTGDGGSRPGLLVPAEDAGALAAALRRWLTDAELRTRLRRLAGRRRRALTGWPDSARAFADVLTRLAVEPPGRPLRTGR